MNRRTFLRNSALALFGFSVLPPAKTYERVWRVQRSPVIYWTQAPDPYFDARYWRTVQLIEVNMKAIDESPYRCIMDRHEPRNAREITNSFFFGATAKENLSNA